MTLRWKRGSSGPTPNSNFGAIFNFEKNKFLQQKITLFETFAFKKEEIFSNEKNFSSFLNLKEIQEQNGMI